MGGGATARAAAKAAVFGGYRAIRSPWAKGFSSTTTEFDDDDDGEEEERVCIPAPPTTEEADEAVALLKDTLRVLPIPCASSSVRNSVVTEPRSASSMSSGCAAVLGSTAGRIVRVLPSPPSATTHVVRAFSLLQDCPEAQSIVASLATDINVWNAVMKNKKVLDFLNAHKNNVPAEAGESWEEPENRDGDSAALLIPGDGLKELIGSVKQKVKSLVSTISDLFECFIGSHAAGGTATTAIQAVNGGGSSRSFEEKAAAAAAAAATSLVALVIATIVVIMLRRQEI